MADLFVLDALADDLEDIERILLAVNHDEYGWKAEWGRVFTHEDVVTALARLIQRDLVRAFVLSAGADLQALGPGAVPAQWLDAWYEMTPRGRLVHATQLSNTDEAP